MIKINVAKPLTNLVINSLNMRAKKEQIVVVFDNTRGLTFEQMAAFSPNLKISITGGLDPRKEKFNNEYYQERTYYSAKELEVIIDKFEQIERKINPLWSDLEKAMFVYKNLCEYSNYKDGYLINGRSSSRNLLGMISGYSVCSGYAMIFKEAMDRIGIECQYQNQESSHSWNIIKIDRKYHAVDLTWDVCKKTNNECGFAYFCREDERFYDDKSHNISYETEEQKYPVEPIPVDTLVKVRDKISKKNIVTIPTTIIDSVEKAKINDKEIRIINQVPYLRENTNNTFMRDDGSSFLLIPTAKKDKGVNEFIYLIYDRNAKAIRATKIYSEMDLIHTNSLEHRDVANSLMSTERMARKINNFNGYVGYLGSGSSVYYNRDFEERVTNKFR